MSIRTSSGATVRSLEAKVAEYHQRLRVLQVSHEQLESGWESSRLEREAAWGERLGMAERARKDLEARCLVLEKRLMEQQNDSLHGEGGGGLRSLHG